MCVGHSPSIKVATDNLGELTVRRQTPPHGLAARWPLRPLDIDPYVLPVRYSLPVDNGAEHARLARDLIEIRPGSVAVQHEVSGVPAVRRAFTLDDFAGVAIRIERLDNAVGGFAISVNLHHPDPKLCFPLHMSMSSDMSEAGTCWQSWGRSLKLPLLLPEVDGSWREPVERFGKLAVNSPHRRPARLNLAARRSTISLIREPGDPGLMRRCSGREIIARN